MWKFCWIRSLETGYQPDILPQLQQARSLTSVTDPINMTWKVVSTNVWSLHPLTLWNVCPLRRAALKPLSAFRGCFCGNLMKMGCLRDEHTWKCVCMCVFSQIPRNVQVTHPLTQKLFLHHCSYFPSVCCIFPDHFLSSCFILAGRQRSYILLQGETPKKGKSQSTCGELQKQECVMEVSVRTWWGWEH